MLKQFFILTLKGIRYRPTRSWLTIVGVIIGVMLVVIILSLGSGIQSAVSRTLQMFGSDLIIIFPGEETNPLVGFLGGQKFREKDLMALEDIPGVEFVMPMEVKIMNVEYKGEKKTVMIHAAPWKELIKIMESSQGVNLAKGDWPDNNQSNEIVLGYIAENSLFKNKVRIGDEIILKSKRMKVIGAVSEIGNQMDDNTMYISLDMFRTLTGTRQVAGSAFVKIASGADPNLVAKQIESKLDKQEVVQDFSVITPEKANALVGSVLTIVELAFILIAFISLLVGAVGIMNTMYTSVLERTKQIGIMKAIGASSDAILSLFLIESGMIGFVGGILGIILGVFIAFLVGLAAGDMGIGGLFSFAALDFYGFGVILIITFITGILSGIFPARKAAKMEPAEALRYE